MGFKSDKQRKGFFASNPIKSISNLSFKAKQKILDIQTDRAIKSQAKESKILHNQLQKEHEKEAKENILNKKKVLLEKIKLDKELELQKANIEREKILESKRTGLQSAREIILTPDEKILLQNIKDRKQAKADKREELRLKIRGGLIVGGKAIGRGAVAIGRAVAEKPKPKRKAKKKRKS